MQKKTVKAGTLVTWKDPETAKDITGPLGCDMAVYSFQYRDPKTGKDVDERISFKSDSLCETFIDGLIAATQERMAAILRYSSVLYATAEALDERAIMCGLARDPGEDDDHLRERCREVMSQSTI